MAQMYNYIRSLSVQMCNLTPAFPVVPAPTTPPFSPLIVSLPGLTHRLAFGRFGPSTLHPEPSVCQALNPPASRFGRPVQRRTVCDCGRTYAVERRGICETARAMGSGIALPGDAAASVEGGTARPREAAPRQLRQDHSFDTGDVRNWREVERRRRIWLEKKARPKRGRRAGKDEINPRAREMMRSTLLHLILACVLVSLLQIEACMRLAGLA
ncbi:hypothetical protein PVAP13_5NG243481 [Panicum virgatum]|uniref:Uncharacterized protein n=1 Tax=Panicum virgatum TaxID=38727 RepID=A0A8T0RV42_PANVG|nr:hypothetical protein PVAP13_5NG243481 [Panicum virgatum]